MNFFSLEKMRHLAASLKVRMFLLVMIVAFLTGATFIFYSNHLGAGLQSSVRIASFFEVRGVIQELNYASAQTPVQRDAANKRARDLLTQESLLLRESVDEIGPVGQKAISELRALMDLLARGVRTADSAVLSSLLLQSLQYPSEEVYEALAGKSTYEFTHLDRNRWIAFGVLVGVIFLLFVVLQVVSRGVGMIAAASRAIATAADSGILDVSKRVTLRINDETKVISDNFNHYFEVLETYIANTFGALQRTHYQSQQMYNESEGSALEIQVINRSVDRMNHQISTQMASVSEAVAALEEMERTLDVIFNNISRQSSAMTESAATLEEMGRQIEGIAKISNDTSDLAKSLTDAANKGSTAVESSVVSIRDVSEYSGQIIKLLKLITDIAKQTNLLAMNASIEAAHAGEAGRGFAIVAEEIRRLSETTNKNAKEIRTVVDTMVEKIENSVGQAQTAGEDLASITRFAANVDERVAQLNGMLQEQNTATQETIQTIESLVNLAQEIKLSMEEQQYALNEYSSTMSTLRDNFNDTESTLNSHTSSVDNLLQIMRSTRCRITINRRLMNEASKLLTSFVVNESLISTDKMVQEEQDQAFIQEIEKIQSDHISSSET